MIIERHNMLYYTYDSPEISQTPNMTAYLESLKI